MADFDSRQFEWADLTMVIGGRVVEGCVHVEYSKKKTKEYLYGRGGKPKAIQHGNFEYEGKIGIWQSELIAMEESSTNGEILDQQFAITVAYVPKTGGRTKVRTLLGAEFTDITEALAQGDSHMKLELPIMFRDIKDQ